MKKEDLRNKTIIELESELKKLKSTSGIVIGISMALYAVTIYGLLTKEDTSTDLALMVVAIACAASLPSQFGSIKKIRDELKSKKN